MDVELTETAAQLLIDGGHRKMAAAAIETGQITRTQLRPIARLHAARQHGIEYQGSGGREREAALGTAARRGAALHPRRHPFEIVAIAAETLRPEIIRRPMRAQRIQLRLQLLARPSDIAQSDAKAIAGQRSPLELAQIAARLEHFEFRRAHGAPKFRGGAEIRHAEPLHGDGMPVLQPGVAYIVGRDARQTRNLRRHPARIRGAFLHPQQPVRSRAGGFERQLFLDVKIFRNGFERGGRQRRAMRPGRL
jgi:hypothetical protein